MKVRAGHQDVKTPLHNDVMLRASTIAKGGRLFKVAFAQLCSDFVGQNLKANFIHKQLKWYREQLSEGQPAETLSLGRMRRECGRGVQKFTIEVARKLIDIYNQNRAKLSYMRLTSKVGEEGTNMSPVTVILGARS